MKLAISLCPIVANRPKAHRSNCAPKAHRSNCAQGPTGEYATMCAVGESPDTLQALPHRHSRPTLEGPAQLTF